MTSARGLALIEQLQDLKHQSRLLEADMADVISEMDRENTAQDTGHASLSALIAEALRINRAKAAQLVANAAHVAEELTPTGHVTPAPLPTVRQALRDGLIDGEHIHEVAEAIKALPTWVGVADRELVEATLGAAARSESPLVLRRHAEMLLERLNQDGAEPKQEERQAEPHNSFTYKRGERADAVSGGVGAGDRRSLRKPAHRVQQTPVTRRGRARPPVCGAALRRRGLRHHRLGGQSQ